MKKVPSYILKYLWDTPKDKVDANKHSSFIIERVLEYGDEKSIEWLNDTYKKGEIVSVLKEIKKISPKTGNFFALYYNIPKEELLCIQEPFTQKQNRF